MAWETRCAHTSYRKGAFDVLSEDRWIYVQCTKVNRMQYRTFKMGVALAQWKSRYYVCTCRWDGAVNTLTFVS